MLQAKFFSSATPSAFAVRVSASTLRFASAESSNQQWFNHASPSDSDDTPARRWRVLVVDDAPDITEMLGLMLSYAGYEVVTAFSGAQALEAARRVAANGSFDAIISDLGMPEMSGYELAEQLREIPAYQNVPLVAVTGFTLAEDRDRAHNAGFDEFVPKPVDPMELVALLTRLCG